MPLRASLASDWPTNDLVTDHSAWRAKWDYYPGVQLVLFNRLLHFLRDSAKTRLAMQSPSRPVTITVSLPGGQTRLREMILFVAKECSESVRFGAVKLNKIIWKADFDSFAERGVPVTGRAYKRQKLGPVLHEMVPLQNDMARAGQIFIEQVDLGDDFIELRTIALQEPNLSLFSEEDLQYVKRSICHYWTMTGTESSDESHGVAWKTRKNGDFMPYETALLSDRRPQKAQMDRLKRIVESRQLVSR